LKIYIETGRIFEHYIHCVAKMFGLDWLSKFVGLGLAKCPTLDASEMHAMQC